MTKAVHTPVLMQEILSTLNPSSGKKYLDATVGAGGHSLKILESGAIIVGIDRDQDILEIARKLFDISGYSGKYTLYNGSFSTMQDLTKDDNYDGILMDLGVSSYQLDTADRGFSFRFDADLDMRMDKKLQVTAADLVNGLGRKELYELFTKLGEERFARRIADAIIKRRRIEPIKTTSELASVVSSVVRKTGKTHPATKVFQALRIAVNDELNELKAALPSALSMLKTDGIVVVISFHSLEDRIVKEFFKQQEEKGFGTILTRKPLMASYAESQDNPRSRSAKLRALKKIKGAS